MNVQEYLLEATGEECCEVQRECSKINRFGLKDVNFLEPQGPNNQQRLVLELNDLLGVVRFLAEEGIIPDNWESLELQLKKQVKLVRMMQYSADMGTLDRETFKPFFEKYGKLFELEL